MAITSIDEAINNLSSEELDLLNSDPGMLKDFKAKFSAPPPSPYTQAAIEGVKAALPTPDYAKPLAPSPSNLNNPAMAGAETALQTLRDPSRISPSVSQPSQLFGNYIEKQSGSPTAGFVSSVLTDPQTYIGAGEGELPTSIKKGVAALGETLSGVDKRSFMEWINNPGKVLKAKPSAVTGKTFQAAKEAAGLTLEEERQLATSEGLRTKTYNKLMSKVDSHLNPLKEGEKITLAAKGTLPEQIVTHAGKMMGDTPEELKATGFSEEAIKEMQQPMYNLSAGIEGHPAGSTVSAKTLRDLGYTVPKRGSEVEMSVAELLKAKKAGQLIAKSKPEAAGLIQKDIHEKVNPLLEKIAPDVYQAQQANHMSLVKENISKLLPQGNGLTKTLRTLAMLGGSAFHGIGLLESPAIDSLGMLGLNQGAKYALPAAPSMALKGFGLNSFDPSGYSELQSLKDRMGNQDAQ